MKEEWGLGEDAKKFSKCRIQKQTEFIKAEEWSVDSKTWKT